jgi:uncharacterized protein YjbJ (UPF0337 family)
MSDKAKGKAKEVAGKVSGDEELESEGRAQHTKGQVEDTAKEARDTAKGLVQAAKDALDDDDEEEEGDPSR